MTQSLADLQAELAAVEDKMVAETDPTEVAVLAGRIIELKNEVAAAAPASSSKAEAPPVPAQAPKSAFKPATRSVPKSAPAPAALRTDGPTLAEYVAAGYSAANYPPSGYAAKAAAPAPAPTKRTGIDPSILPIALRPTRN